MISLSKFRQELLPLFRIMIDTHLYVDVNYKDRAYRVKIEDLGYKVPRTRGGRPRLLKTLPAIEEKKCPQCKQLCITGVCMNTACVVNSKYMTGI